MDQDNGKKWEMPKPVFRRSTGELVTPSERLDIDPEPDTLAPDAPDESEVETGEFDISSPATSTAPAAPQPVPSGSAAPLAAADPLASLYDPPSGPLKAPAASPPAPVPVPGAPAVEPQPFISEQFTADKIDVKTSVPDSGTKPRPWLTILGLLLLFAAAAGIAALVYFLFFAARTPVTVN